jgi:outer membrane protein OmpA-like peptidoglycan-associated protein
MKDHSRYWHTIDKEESFMNWTGKQIAIVISVLAAFGSNAAFPKEIRSEAKKVEGAANLQTITLKGDTLFAFGDDKLSSGGKKSLDDLLKKGSLSPMTRYRIEGHTDHIGDRKANGALSLRRAESVRRYMLSKDRNLRLESAGMGESRPVVQCSDKLAKQALTKCLAPNRRVTIEPIY